MKTPEGKASRASDERNRGLQATLERGADRATQPSGVFKRSLTRKLHRHGLDQHQPVLRLGQQQILGSTDAMKLRSSMTLFHRAAPDDPVFAEVLDRFYGGLPDERTDALLG